MNRCPPERRPEIFNYIIILMTVKVSKLIKDQVEVLQLKNLNESLRYFDCYFLYCKVIGCSFSTSYHSNVNKRRLLIHRTH